MSHQISINRRKIDKALEEVCQLGCITVNEIICEIERGVLPGPAKMLNKLECTYLLEELRAIMRTYNT